MSSDSVDLLIVGGGITGTAIARDAAGRGLQVVLAERQDLAAEGSSKSTKIVQGGMDALGFGTSSIIRHALRERNLLFRHAPHLVRPARFLLPADPKRLSPFRTSLRLRAYDLLGAASGQLASRRVDLRRGATRELFKPEITTGFAFTDGLCDDTRLVILNALEAAEHGAELLTRTRLTAARRAHGLWYALLHRGGGRPTRAIRARALVNTTGPWQAEFLGEALETPPRRPPRLIKGGHLLVAPLSRDETVLVLPDGRGGMVHVVPYQGYSLIGPVVQANAPDPGADDLDDAEVADLLDVLGGYLVRPPTADDVEFTFAAVWAAPDEAQSRHVFDIDLQGDPDEAPLVGIRGGSITTHRQLAEHVVDALQPRLGFTARPWTAQAYYPGGDFGGAALEDFVTGLRAGRPWLPVDLANRWVRTYGTRVHRILDRAGSLRELGEDLGGGLFEAEVDYLRRVELAQSEEDVLWRRTKLGLSASEATTRRLRNWMDRGAHRSAVA